MKISLRSWFILLLLSLIWGSSFILMKRGLDAFSSNQVAALRISIAFLFLSPLLIKYWKFDWKKNIKGLIFMGVFGNLIPAFLFTLSETQISSSLAGMLNALTPIFTIIIASFWLKTKATSKQTLGIIIGFIAAFCLMIFDSATDIFKNISYGLLILLATIFYAISVNGIKKYLGHVNPIQATVLAFSITGPIALTFLFTSTNFISVAQSHPLALQSLGYISILAIVGSAISVILYSYLIKTAGVIFASSCTYLIPIAAMFWGIADGETINAIQITSIVVIIFSVYLINRD